MDKKRVVVAALISYFLVFAALGLHRSPSGIRKEASYRRMLIRKRYPSLEEMSKSITVSEKVNEVSIPPDD